MCGVPWNTAVMRSRAASAVSVAILAVVLAGCTAEAPPPSSGAGSWRALAPAPTTRTEVVAAASGDRVYVVGGLRTGGASLATVEVFDTAAGAWTTGPDLPVAVDHAMATTVDDVVHVFGGYLDNGTPSDRAFRLDGEAWRELAALPEGRAAGTAVAHGTAVYVAGGIGPDGLARAMLVYDAATDRWSTAPGPPTPREHLGGAGFAGLVYTVGGRVAGSAATSTRSRRTTRPPGAGPPCPRCPPPVGGSPPPPPATVSWSPSAVKRRRRSPRRRRTTCGRPVAGARTAAHTAARARCGRGRRDALHLRRRAAPRARRRGRDRGDRSRILLTQLSKSRGTLRPVVMDMPKAGRREWVGLAVLSLPS